VQVVYPNAAGIDIGSESHFVAVPGDGGELSVREFRAFTADLIKLADWLEECGITHVAMESTGIYWIALYELLEARGFDVRLVDPRQLKTVPGRKSDVQDCQWIQQLHSFGLLAAAFRPAESVCVLRAYMRQRAMLVESAATHIQHMQKALSQMNVKLEKVLSDITGVTGLAIIDAILGGQRDPRQLAALRDVRCKRSEREIALALQGNWRKEHLFSLKQAVELFRTYQRQIEQCDVEIHKVLEAQPAVGDSENLPPDIRRGKTPKRNDPEFDARADLYRMTGVDLTTIRGINAHTALKVVSEIGTDMSRWKTAKHFTSWLALAPGTKKSGGKVLSSRTKASKNRAAHALRLAANSLQRADTALGAFFRRIKSRHGSPKAITATARKLATAIYNMLKYGQNYVERGAAFYESQFHERLIHSLSRKAAKLGYQLVPEKQLTPESNG
jgi:transposase